MTDGETLILLTRPRPASEAFRDRIAGDVAAPVLIAPVIDIEPIGPEVDPTGMGGVIFTSANAVARTRPVAGMTAWCVGDTTAAVADAAGFSTRSAGGNASDLISLILGANAGSAPLLYIRGEIERGNVAASLNEKGIACGEAITYRQVDIHWSDALRARLAAAGRVIAPVFSPRSAMRLSEELGGCCAPHVLAISQAAATAWVAPGLVEVIEAPGTNDMVQALVQAVGRDSPC